ncbi:MAG: hypothetical protein VX672_00175, partial [Planctomycetota bacterium]|nr:hypothetical protein [Planctomycetota bacterium]
RLDRYALAALPACALGSAAVADIVYTQVDISIYDDTTTFSMGAAELSFLAYNLYGASPGFNYLTGRAVSGQFAVSGSYGGYAYPRGFTAGEEIGDAASFDASNRGALFGMSVSTVGVPVYNRGQWYASAGSETRLFLGIAIMNGSDVNYGWVDISWSGQTGAVIHGYAYETDVNTAIVAGATESSGPVVPGAPTAVGLGGLAAGAAGIRRKRSA